MFIYFQCIATTGGCIFDSDCTPNTHQNGVCSDIIPEGKCTCGATNDVCKGSTPLCGKTKDPGTQAKPEDGKDANCQVCKYSL